MQDPAENATPPQQHDVPVGQRARLAQPHHATKPEEDGGEAARPRPIHPPTPMGRALKTSERIAAAIVAQVVNSNLGPGDRLPNENAMLEQFQVGRASVREAMRILENHGLISLRSGPGGGPVLLAVNPRDVARTFSLYLHLSQATIRELTEARLFLEPVIARMAAETQDPESMRRLEEALELEASVPHGDDQQNIYAANNFHYVLATMTGNKVIDLMATALKELHTSRVVAGGLVTGLNHDELHEEHRELGLAILAGKAARAERLADEHARYYLGKVAEVPGFADSTITWG